MVERGPLRVFVLGTRGFPNIQGGVEKHCEELYPRLVRLGCEVTVFTRTPYVPREKRLKEWEGVRFIHLWCPRNKYLETISHSFLSAIVSIFKRPDVLHLHNIGPALSLPLLKLAGLKTIVTCHSLNYEHVKWGALARLVLKFGEKLMLSLPNKVVFVSRHLKERIGRDKKCIHINNGISISSGNSKRGVLERYGIDKGKYILTVGRITPEKGFHDLLEAYYGIDTSWKLVIVGDADHETRYSRQLKEKGVKSSGVVMTGYLQGDELAAIYSNAGMFVLPSHFEGLPIALLEAMSHGLLCLVSSIPGNLEIIGDKGFIFPPGDVDAIRAKISHYLDNPPDENIIRSQRHRIVEEFNWDSIAEYVLAVYRDVLEGNGK